SQLENRPKCEFRIVMYTYAGANSVPPPGYHVATAATAPTPPVHFTSAAAAAPDAAKKKKVVNIRQPIQSRQVYLKMEPDRLKTDNGWNEKKPLISSGNVTSAPQIEDFIHLLLHQVYSSTSFRNQGAKILYDCCYRFGCSPNRIGIQTSDQMRRILAGTNTPEWKMTTCRTKNGSPVCQYPPNVHVLNFRSALEQYSSARSRPDLCAEHPIGSRPPWAVLEHRTGPS
ncbi:unnamed protein product, partial [Nesidiocoris tenuis]